MTGTRRSKKHSNATLVERVRTRIVNEIVSGRFRPGDRLREVEIAQLLGVSRTPIREAVRALEAEGLISIEPRQGFVIAKLTRVQISALFEYRETLEGLATEVAAAKVTDDDLARLAEILQEEDSADADDLEKLVRCNVDFHATIYKSTGNRFLIQSLESLRTSLALVPGTALIYKKRQKDVAKEHRNILGALEARSGSKARSAAVYHVRNSNMARIVNTIKTPSGTLGDS